MCAWGFATVTSRTFPSSGDVIPLICTPSMPRAAFPGGSQIGFSFSKSRSQSTSGVIPNSPF